jgi:hypothetical protein
MASLRRWNTARDRKTETCEADRKDDRARNVSEGVVRVGRNDPRPSPTPSHSSASGTKILEPGAAAPLDSGATTLDWETPVLWLLCKSTDPVDNLLPA